VTKKEQTSKKKRHGNENKQKGKRTDPTTIRVENNLLQRQHPAIHLQKKEETMIHHKKKWLLMNKRK
jgi:hypothetical protein